MLLIQNLTNGCLILDTHHSVLPKKESYSRINIRCACFTAKGESRTREEVDEKYHGSARERKKRIHRSTKERIQTKQRTNQKG